MIFPFGGGGETRGLGRETTFSQLEKRSADNSSFFPSVNILTEERSEPAKEITKKLKNNIMHLCYLAYLICLLVLKLRGKLNRNRVKS